MTLLLLDLQKLKINLLTKKDNNYNFMNGLKEYDVPINDYYNCLNNMNEYKMKNLWNHIIIRWNLMKKDLEQELKNNNIDYSEKYSQKHGYITHEELNKLLNKFCNDNLLKLIFVINSIQNYIYPI